MDIPRPDYQKALQRRRWIIGGVVSLVLGTAAYGLSRLEPAAPRVERASVWIDTVKRGDLMREVRGPGQLVPREIRWIAAETPARVERIVVRPGATVQPEDLILELSNPEVSDAVLAARAEVQAARADLEAQRLALQTQALDQQARVAEIHADHASALLQAEAEGELNRKGIVSALQFRQSELRAEQLGVRLKIERERVTMLQRNVEAQLDAARARLEQLENTLSLRERQADALQVRAGMQGVLQVVAVEEGQQVTAGLNLARVARPDVLMAELRIPETQAKDVILGQTVRIDTRNGVVEGSVTRIDPAVANGAVQVDVDLIGSLPPGARPDLSVDGTIEIETLHDVLYVGRPAFGQIESDTTLFRLDAEGTIARRVPVRLGRASVSLIEVQRGLKVGDRVVLSDTSNYDRSDRLRLE